MQQTISIYLTNMNGMDRPMSSLENDFKKHTLNPNASVFVMNTCKPQNLNHSKLTSVKIQYQNHGKKRTKKRSETFESLSFEPYWSLDDIKKNLEAKKLIKSKLRINQRNFNNAYLSDTSDGANVDIFIDNLKDRNRALNGDIVAAKIKDKYEWKIINNAMVSLKFFILTS
jgi:exoribonuclease R